MENFDVLNLMLPEKYISHSNDNRCVTAATPLVPSSAW